MLNNILIVFLIIAQFMIVSCARKKSTGLDCGTQIKQAEATLQTKRDAMDKSLTSSITNLITAAKIHRQHQEEMLCLDKIQRAISLLQQDGPAQTQSK